MEPLEHLMSSFPVLFRFVETEQQNQNMLLLWDGENGRPLHVLYNIIMSSSNGEIVKIQRYYEEVVAHQDSSTFKSHFRMSKSTFEVVVNHIGHSDHFHKRNEELGGRKQIGPEKALLVTLWTLATPDSYRSIGERFGIAKSSVYFCLKTVIGVILHELSHRFIKWPTEEEKVSIANKFRRYGLPNVIGAIDGCHIPIKKPVENSIDYFNRKKFYSMVLQGVCQADLKFIDCDIRWPGSVHDGRVLRTSEMYSVADQLCEPDYYLIGDSAYPLKLWLMAPYRNNGHLLPQQVYFNRMLAKTRVVIENTFALLKGRFRRLKDYLDRDKPEDVIQTVMAACVLHNICLVEGEDEVEQYILEGRDDDHAIPMMPLYNQHDNEAAERRDEICRNMWHNNNIFLQ